MRKTYYNDFKDSLVLKSSINYILHVRQTSISFNNKIPKKMTTIFSIKFDTFLSLSFYNIEIKQIVRNIIKLKNFTKTRIIFINLKFLLDTILFECIEKQQLLPYHHLRTLLLTPYFGSLKVGSYKIDDILLPSN